MFLQNYLMHLHRAVAAMNWTRPAHHQSRLEAIETNVAVAALVGLVAHHGAAVAMRGERIELTRAAICAIAIDKLATFDRPFRHSYHPVVRAALPRQAAH